MRVLDNLLIMRALLLLLAPESNEDIRIDIIGELKNRIRELDIRERLGLKEEE